MFLTTAVWVYARAILAALLNCFKTAPSGPVLTTPHADLYVNNYVPAETDTMSAYTLASFPGYAASALTFTAAVNTGPNTLSVVAPAEFQMTATGTVTGTCYGCVMSDGAGNFQGASKFAAPVLFALPGDTLFLNVALPGVNSSPIDG